MREDVAEILAFASILVAGGFVFMATGTRARRWHGMAALVFWVLAIGFLIAAMVGEG